MKVATWNVNGIRARYAQFAEWMGAARPDVVCLQEIKASPEQIPEMLCNLEGYWCYWHGERAYSGVALHVRRDSFPVKPVFSHPAFDHETRIVQAEIEDTVYASVYVPNGGKDYEAKIDFVKALIGYAAAIRDQGKKLVICGDFNISRSDMDVHPKERKPNIIGQRPEERELLEEFIRQGLVDVGRSLNPDDENYFTWWAPWRSLRQRNIGWRLDYVFASTPLAERATSCPSFREIGTSDHAPVVATFE